MGKSLIDRVNNTGGRKGYGGFAGGYGNTAWLGAASQSTDYTLRDRKYDLALAYLYIEPVRASIDLYADAISRIPIELVYSPDNNPDNEQAIARTDDTGTPRHEMLKRILTHQTEYGVDYFTQQMFELMLYDQIAIELIRPENQRMRQMARQMHIANGVKVLRGAALSVEGFNGKINAFYYSGDDGVTPTLDPDDVAYYRGYNPVDDYIGSSALLAVLAELNIIQDIRKHVKRVLRKAHRPDVFASPSENARISPQDIADLRRETQRYRADDSMSMMLLGTSLDFSTVAPPNLSNTVPLSEDERKKIFSIFGVSPALLGDNSTTTYQQAPGTYAQFIQSRVKAKLEIIINHNNNNVLPQFGLTQGYALRYDLSNFDVVTEDERDRITLQLDQLNNGIVTYDEYAKASGVTVADELRNMIKIEGIPVPITEVANLWRYKYAAPAALDVAQAQEAQSETEANEQATIDDAFASIGAYKDAPANTTFDSVTYNGVTVQASPVRPSSRDDKKFMRWVRHDGSERLIHWGQPDEQMERDNPEARAAFESRHSCDTKKDPFSAGFWACWAWQPNAPVRSIKHDEGCSCGDCETLPYKALFADDIAYDDDALHERQRNELKVWLKYARNRDGKSSMLEFDSDIIEPYIKYAVIDRLRDANYTGDIASHILDVFEDETIKTVGSYRRQARRLFTRLWDGRDGFSQFITGMNSLIRQQYNQAFRKGVNRAGKRYNDLSGEEQAELNTAILNEQQYVLDLAADIFANSKRNGGKLAPFRTRVELWIARYDHIDDLGFTVAMADAPLQWSYDPAKEHCVDCINLNGKVYPASFWKSYVVPRSSKLACFGTFCGCKLSKPPEGTKLTRGAKPRLRGAS